MPREQGDGGNSTQSRLQALWLGIEAIRDRISRPVTAPICRLNSAHTMEAETWEAQPRIVLALSNNRRAGQLSGRRRSSIGTRSSDCTEEDFTSRSTENDAHLTTDTTRGDEHDTCLLQARPGDDQQTNKAAESGSMLLGDAALEEREDVMDSTNPGNEPVEVQESEKRDTDQEMMQNEVPNEALQEKPNEAFQEKQNEVLQEKQNEVLQEKQNEQNEVLQEKQNEVVQENQNEVVQENQNEVVQENHNEALQEKQKEVLQEQQNQQNEVVAQSLEHGITDRVRTCTIWFNYLLQMDVHANGTSGRSGHCNASSSMAQGGHKRKRIARNAERVDMQEEEGATRRCLLHEFVNVSKPILKDVPDWVTGSYEEFRDNCIRLCTSCATVCEWTYFLVPGSEALRELCAACVVNEGYKDSARCFMREGMAEYLSKLNQVATDLISEGGCTKFIG